MVKPFKGIPHLDCYADANFAGLYHRDDPQDPAGARSRTGFVITLGENPILWKSKLQTETATSTMHTKYVAASTAMRALVHLRHVHGQIVDTLKLPFDKKSNISLVFEDNQACFQLATNDPPCMMPQSHTIVVKHHWFREQLSPEMIVSQRLSQPANWPISSPSLYHVTHSKD